MAHTELRGNEVRKLSAAWREQHVGRHAVVLVIGSKRMGRFGPKALLEDHLEALLPGATAEVVVERHRVAEAFYFHERALALCVVIGRACAEAVSKCREARAPLLRWTA